jgi:hypothetical protein
LCPDGGKMERGSKILINERTNKQKQKKKTKIKQTNEVRKSVQETNKCSHAVSDIYRTL